MKLSLGADSAGKPLLDIIVAHLKAKGEHEIENLSAAGFYADLAAEVAGRVASGKADRAILCCGTGIGVCIAANKVKGVLAALAQDELSAQLSRTHNNANVLCLSADLTGTTLAKRIVDTFMKTNFEGGRHERRIHKIHEIEEGRAPTK